MLLACLELNLATMLASTTHSLVPTEAITAVGGVLEHYDTDKR